MRKSWLLVLLAGVGIPATTGLLFVLVFLVPILWLFSPFHGAPHPGGTQAVRQYYLPLEQAAASKYCRPTTVLVPIYKKSTSKAPSGKKVQTKKIVGYKRYRECKGVTVAFVQAVMRQESDGWAIAVSNKNAIGLMQVMPGKLQPSMQKGKSPLDPATNIDRGVQFLDAMYFRFGGNLPLVAAAYNAGPKQVQQWIARYGTSDWSQIATHDQVQQFAGGQTYDYVQNVMKFYLMYSAPSQKA